MSEEEGNWRGFGILIWTCIGVYHHHLDLIACENRVQLVELGNLVEEVCKSAILIQGNQILGGLREEAVGSDRCEDADSVHRDGKIEPVRTDEPKVEHDAEVEEHIDDSIECTNPDNVFLRYHLKHVNDTSPSGGDNSSLEEHKENHGVNIFNEKDASEQNNIEGQACNENVFAANHINESWHPEHIDRI